MPLMPAYQNKLVGEVSSGSPTQAGLAAVGQQAFNSHCPPGALKVLDQHETDGPTESLANCSQRGGKGDSEDKETKSNDGRSVQLPLSTGTKVGSLPCSTTLEWTLPYVATANGDNRRDKTQNLCILHLCQDVVKPIPFDAKAKGLGSSISAYKLAQVVNKMDAKTYTRLATSSPRTLLKLIYQSLQNVTVHKKPCHELMHYLRAIDDLLAVHKSLGMASTDDLARVLVSLQEKLVVAYILVKSCESRTSNHNSFLDKIPYKISLIQGELQRIIPVLHRAILQQNLHSTLLPVVRGCTLRTGNACDITSSDAPRHQSVKSSAVAASAKENCINSVSTTNGAGRAHCRQPTECPISARCTWPDGSPRKEPLQKNHMNVTPRFPDFHTLRFSRRPMKLYICRACNKLGDSCAYYCETCNYGVHPECLELNEARQRLEEVSITTISGAKSQLS